MKSKIAFYPTIFSLFGAFFAFFMVYAENVGVSKYLVEHVPWLVINNIDTARVILTTFIAGLISIMVFSFSMVMILLNQASSNFSPRVLPGLISNRRHQYILGIYNACLLYCIFTLITIEPTGDTYQLPGFSVLLSILFMTTCLGAFIYFVHSISQEIQVGTILSKIFLKAKNRLSYLLEHENQDFEMEDTNEWIILNSMETGYFQDANFPYLRNICETNDLKIETLLIKGSFVLKGNAILKINKSIDDELIEDIYDALKFSKGELIEENYVLAFKQITEVAVKAMSPGINDPGTAINAIDYLTELFRLRLKKRDTSVYRNDDGHPIIFIKSLNFETLMYSVMASLRTYCKNDVLLIRKLFQMLSALSIAEEHAEPQYKNIIMSEMESLLYDAKQNINNEKDLIMIEKLYDKSK
ncbi:DUF2254 domain-containing protein [Winogradskyella sp. A3E31]|uniref:DUF2254 domain-containing protein n=1 Tax=Winogradskyella sp. A3E31 TaxID=3349637 RepID=UPI00398BAE1F